MVCESGGQQLYCTFACSFQFFFIILWQDVNVITERVEGRKVTNLLWLWWEKERDCVQFFWFQIQDKDYLFWWFYWSIFFFNFSHWFWYFLGNITCISNLMFKSHVLQMDK
jgi:hypothetical protein